MYCYWTLQWPLKFTLISDSLVYIAVTANDLHQTHLKYASTRDCALSLFALWLAHWLLFCSERSGRGVLFLKSIDKLLKGKYCFVFPCFFLLSWCRVGLEMFKYIFKPGLQVLFKYLGFSGYCGYPKAFFLLMSLFLYSIQFIYN